MKMEVEITEAEIKSAIERKIRVAIADETNAWGSDRFIKDSVKKHWEATVEKMILEGLQDSPKIKEKIAAAIEAKLKGQLTAMMKVKP